MNCHRIQFGNCYPAVINFFQSFIMKNPVTNEDPYIIKKIPIRKPTAEEKKSAKGRCYECSFRYMSKLSDEEKHRYRLVHGDMIGTTGEVAGIQYDHAWVERDGDTVIDLKHDLRKKPMILPKDVYYAMFNVVEETMKKYTQKEMYFVGYAAGAHYGPWH